MRLAHSVINRALIERAHAQRTSALRPLWSYSPTSMMLKFPALIRGVWSTAEREDRSPVAEPDIRQVSQMKCCAFACCAPDLLVQLAWSSVIFFNANILSHICDRLSRCKTLKMVLTMKTVQPIITRLRQPTPNNAPIALTGSNGLLA